jgi:hypothetical protein
MKKAGSALSDIHIEAALFDHNLFQFLNNTIRVRFTRPKKPFFKRCG